MFKNKIQSQIIINREEDFLKKDSSFQVSNFLNIVNFILDEMIALNLIKNDETRELSIYFTDNNEMHKINFEYSEIDSATDVLAFPFLTQEIIGEIIISLDQIIIQANDYHISYLHELTKMIIHGILHILGYDHEEPDEKEIMFNLQNQILLEVLKKLKKNENKFISMDN